MFCGNPMYYNDYCGQNIECLLQLPNLRSGCEYYDNIRQFISGDMCGNLLLNKVSADQQDELAGQETCESLACDTH